MGKKRGINEAYFINQQCKNFHQQRLYLICNNLFRWDGELQEKAFEFIEKTLFHEGVVAIANDPKEGIICCSCTPTSKLDIYGEPLGWYLTGLNGYHRIWSSRDIVIIKNNINMIPTSELMEYYIKRLWEIDRTIDTNIIQQKTTKIIKCDESQKLTVENVLMQQEGNVAYILGSDQLNNVETDVIDLKTEFIAKDLLEIKKEIWRECLEVISVNSANTSKRERLITEEVNSNNQILELCANIFFVPRKKACEEMLKKFNINVSVERSVALDGTIYDRVGEVNRE